jgi:hypothetical protein
MRGKPPARHDGLRDEISMRSVSSGKQAALSRDGERSRDKLREFGKLFDTISQPLASAITRNGKVMISPMPKLGTDDFTIAFREVPDRNRGACLVKPTLRRRGRRVIYLLDRACQPIVFAGLVTGQSVMRPRSISGGHRSRGLRFSAGIGQPARPSDQVRMRDQRLLA